MGGKQNGTVHRRRTAQFCSKFKTLLDGLKASSSHWGMARVMCPLTKK